MVGRRDNHHSGSGFGRALGLSFTAHAMLVAVLMGANWFGHRAHKPLPRPVIQASLVDIQPLLERQHQADALADRARRDAKRLRERKLAAEKRKRKQAEHQRIATQRKMEQERMARKRREMDKLAEAKRAQAEQQKQLAALRAEREQAELDSQAAELKLAELRQKTRAQENVRLKQLENERRKLLLAAESRTAQTQALASERDQYMLTIQMTVTRNWRRPPTAQPGVRCVVSVHQIPGGEVISSDVANPCNADSATRCSIINAVRRSSPLPYHGFEKVFEREIRFNFSYDG